MAASAPLSDSFHLHWSLYLNRALIKLLAEAFTASANDGSNHQQALQLLPYLNLDKDQAANDEDLS